MAFEKARQSLSDIEDRLRRAFGLAGPINAVLKAELTPVLIAGDLREPGHSFNRGRSWAYSHGAQTNAGTTYHSVTFDADVLIEAVHFQGLVAVNTSVELYITTPSEAPAVAMSRTAGAWRDRKLLATDIPPIRDSGALYAARTGVDVSLTNRICTWIQPVVANTNPTDLTWRNIPMMLPAGSALNWRIVGSTSNGALACYGRIWT